jgi:hypothetical protein
MAGRQYRGSQDDRRTGLDEAVSLFQDIPDEKEAADKLPTEIAKAPVNQEAQGA